MADGIILGLDIGSKRTGVAVSDPSGTFSFPREVIEASDKKKWIEKVEKLIENEGENIHSIVVGLPLNHHGEEGQDAKNVRQYIALLRDRLQVPVIEWDERFSTLQAERSLLEADVSRAQRKQVIDKVAASLILQSYLDHQRFQKEPKEES